MPHRFAIGDNVEFDAADGRAIDAAFGPYVVTKRFPGPGRQASQIPDQTLPTEPHERIVWESELSAA